MGYRYPRKSKYTLKIRRSSAGLGLYTEEQIRKDAFVVEYFGPLLLNEKADDRGGRYLFRVDKTLTVDGSSRNNLARYINHSCKPNCEAEIDGKRIFIYAKRDIEPGEELTYHYGKEYFKDVIKPKGCRCSYCRKSKSNT